MEKLKKIYDWASEKLRNSLVITMLVLFVFVEIFFPNYADVPVKLMLIGAAFWFMNAIDEKYMPNINFWEKLDDPILGERYAKIICSIILGIFYVIGTR